MLVRGSGLARTMWLGAILAISTPTLLGGCGAALPRPPAAQVSGADYVPVPFAPRVPPVEYIPPRPAKQAVWVDGSWEWTGNRYGWRYGSWVIPPPNAGYARWVVVRRSGDGQLFFAPSRWKDASGRDIDDRSFRYALGPEARARSRPGGPPAGIASPQGDTSVPGPVPVPVDRGDFSDEDNED